MMTTTAFTTEATEATEMTSLSRSLFTGTDGAYLNSIDDSAVSSVRSVASVVNIFSPRRGTYAR